VGLDQVGPRGLSAGELTLQPIELFVGSADPFLEVRHFGGAILAKDPALGDDDLGGEQVRRPDRYSA